MIQISNNVKLTLVLGASTNHGRYSFLAAKSLLQHGHPVILVGRSEGEIDGNKIHKSIPDDVKVDTVTLYLSPDNQKQYYHHIINLKPKRIIFNPGAENQEFEELAAENGIETEEACTLVLLSIGKY